MVDDAVNNAVTMLGNAPVQSNLPFGSGAGEARHCLRYETCVVPCGCVVPCLIGLFLVAGANWLPRFCAHESPSFSTSWDRLTSAYQSAHTSTYTEAFESQASTTCNSSSSCG
jgi:hypothetical protein